MYAGLAPSYCSAGRSACPLAVEAVVPEKSSFRPATARLKTAQPQPQVHAPVRRLDGGITPATPVWRTIAGTHHEVDVSTEQAQKREHLSH